MGRGWWSDKGGRKSECPKARSCHGTSQAEGSAQDAEVSRAQKVCWAIWGVSQHRARAPHATAAGGLRAIWPGCVAVRSKGPLSTEHAYIQVNKAPICDVRRTLSMCTVYFLVRVRMACQRLAAGIVHDDDACTARTRRHRDAPTGPGTSMLVKGDDQYDVHVAEHGGLVLPGMFLVRSVCTALWTTAHGYDGAPGDDASWERVDGVAARGVAARPRGARQRASPPLIRSAPLRRASMSGGCRTGAR